MRTACSVRYEIGGATKRSRGTTIANVDRFKDNGADRIAAAVDNIGPGHWILAHSCSLG